MSAKRMSSISRQVRQSVSTIALLLTLPVISGLVTTLVYSNQYQAMIRRMDRAAELKPLVETTLAENLFSVAAGRASFDASVPAPAQPAASMVTFMYPFSGQGSHISGPTRQVSSPSI